MFLSVFRRRTGISFCIEVISNSSGIFQIARTNRAYSQTGFRKSTAPTSRDLFRNITSEFAPPHILDRVSSLPHTFKPWSPELYDECIAKQKANNFNGPVGHNSLNLSTSLSETSSNQSVDDFEFPE